MKKTISVLILAFFVGIIFISFEATAQMGSGNMGPGYGKGQGMMNDGTAWGTGVFRSNGERIYFTSTSGRGSEITYSGGPASSNWMMMGGRLACVSCHGPNGQGGKQNMGMMQVMDSKDIRWSVLQSEFDAKKFRLAVVKGQDHDGTMLKPDMPRLKINNNDLADLIVYLKTLH
jgi:hypothetical protein